MAESQDTPPSDAQLDFDDNNLKAIATVYFEEGNKEYKRKEASNAVYFYTQGIQVNCKDDVLNAKLYSNRATAHFYLGNYQETLHDATAAVTLQPTFIKAIEKGANACVKLNRYEEARSLCDKGLAIDNNKKTLVDLRTKCLSEPDSSQETERQNMKSMPITHTATDQKRADSLPKTAKDDVGEKCEEGNAYHRQHDFKTAIDYYKRCLDIAKEMGDKAGEGKAYCKLGIAYQSLSVFKTAIDYHKRGLKIAKEVGDKAGEGMAYGNLGCAYQSLGDFKTAIDYYKRCLDIAKDVGDKVGEGKAYGNLGTIYHCVGDSKTAIDYQKRDLKIAKEVGDKAMEGIAYGNLGCAYQSLGDFKMAIDYYKRCLDIAKDVGDKAGEGKAYGNLGTIYQSVGDSKTAIDYHKRDLKIAKEVGDKAMEGRAYGNLGCAYQSLGDFKTAFDYHKRFLDIAKDVGDKAGEGKANGNLGIAYNDLGDFKTAIDYFKRRLDIAKDVGDKAGEGMAYGNLGNTYNNLGDFKTAIYYHNCCLDIAKDVGDKTREGMAYGNLGNAYNDLGYFKTAIDYHKRNLKFAKDVRDKAQEGIGYGNLGNAYLSVGDFKAAIDYFKRGLNISKEVGDKAAEGRVYGNLGSAYQSLGDFKTAIDYHNQSLNIDKDMGNKAEEGKTYCNLGIAYQSLGVFKTAIDCYKRCLDIAKDVGDIAGEGRAYSNLGNAYRSLGEFTTAIEYHERNLKIVKEAGNKAGEGMVYVSLGNAYCSLGDFKTAIEYHERGLEIAKETGDKAGTAISFLGLGTSLELQGSLPKALDCFHSSVRMFNIIRHDLEGKDEWKISYRNKNQIAYTSLWRLLLKQGEIERALLAADQGRAQALNDLMELNYGLKTAQSHLEESACHLFRGLPSTAVFMAIDEQDIVFWVVQEGKDVELRKKELSNNTSLNLNDFLKSLIVAASREIDVRAGVKCEDRSLHKLRDEQVANERSPPTSITPVFPQMSALRTCYDVIIDPIADLIRGDELLLVPEGPLCLAPYAAFVDPNSKYLSDVCRIRMIPSFTSFKMITDSPDSYHSRSGVLLVGDPWVQEVFIPEIKLEQLPFARKEVQMIGRIFHTKPLIGREATKDEVLRRLPSVALIHIAAHGDMKTGEILLAPDTTRASQIPVNEDFLLTMKDVKSAHIRAKLVVLSCCHSGRGEIKAEGVVGIARAFLGAGARAVLVSLWAIDDYATLEFMKSFYSHLVKGMSASESLNKAMKYMRESDQFNEVKHWAPFVLIGDDVTLEVVGGE